MTPRPAAKYRRISDDREGRELGIGRQDEDLDALAERENLVYVASYVDNDISASTKSKKRGADYERMVAAAKAGEFEVIAAYTSGRLTRKPRENEDLIELGQHYGISSGHRGDASHPPWPLRTSAKRKRSPSESSGTSSDRLGLASSTAGYCHSALMVSARSSRASCGMSGSGTTPPTRHG
ncbi:recombinase family protein [Micromonospora sp. D93]|nr:recombinase family protein [Micromonospora sp. D93]